MRCRRATTIIRSPTMRTRHLTLRLGTARDAHAIAELSRALIEHGLGWSWTAQRVSRSIANPDTSTVVAHDGNRVAGFAIMFFGMEDAHLNLLAVDAAYQRSGVGRSLFQWQRESALVAGIALVRLELRAANQGARRFYRSLGFVESGFVPLYYSGREAALRMTLDLRHPAAP
jgi:ribosomal-protein-alanine N-acetyltransferase